MNTQIPSLHHVLASARRSCRYDIEVSPTGNFRISSIDPDDHSRAIQALELYKQSNLSTQQAIQPKAPSPPQKPKTEKPIDPTPSKESDGPLLSEELEPYLRYLKQKKYSRTTCGQTAYTTKIFRELIGDKPVNFINIRDIDTFLHALSVLPSNWPKKKAYRGMHTTAVVDKAQDIEHGRISIQTQQKHIDRLKAFFKWCVERKSMKDNPLGKLRLFKFSAGKPKPRIPFGLQELKLIFSSTNDKYLDEPHKFWVPRIAYYQGMRINEISQLYVDDIRVEDKVRGINISYDRPGQKLKNSNSKRFLPLHPELVKLGLLKYLKEVQASGSPHLFPGLKWGVNGPGHQVSAWFNRTYLRSICGVVDKRQTFHSFRHTFATLAVRSRVPDPEISIMLGHLPGVSQLRRSYAHDATPSEQAKELADIKFHQLPMTKYKSKQFHAYLTRAHAVASREDISSK